MSTKQTNRGTCPSCGKNIATNKHGLLRQHGAHGNANHSVSLCPGTYQKPITTTK